MDILISWLQQGLVAVVPFIVLLGILIFVHELGHFLVARWCGVRVEVFSLGFGRKIFSYKKGDTTYCISLIPLGGYVKMFGEQPGDTINEADKRVSFTHKTVYQRIAIVSAGPLMNFFFAVVLFWALAMIGEEMHRPVLGDIDKATPAFAMGFRPGDTITAVNQEPLETYEQFSKLINRYQNKEVKVSVTRQGRAPSEDLLVPVTSRPNPNILSTDDSIGDIPGLTLMSRGTIVGVKASSPLEAVGLQTGDRVVRINGQEVRYWRDLDPILESISPASAITLDIERTQETGERTSLTLTLAGGQVKSYSLAQLHLESAEVYLAKVAPQSPALKAGLQSRDRILSIEGKPVQFWEDVVTTIKSYDESKTALKFEILRGTEILQLDVTPQMSSQMGPTGQEDKRYTIGIYPMINYAEPETLLVKVTDPGKALVRGFTRTWDVTVMMVMSFVRLFENKISAKNIGGVISIGQAASETFKLGLDKFIQMMALISVNLFILNLLPIPVLDGGHLVFYVIEAVKGSPLSLRKMEMAQQVGLVLLMSLMVFALFNDITRFLGAQ